MPFPFKTLAISHFHPFSKQVKNGKKASISCYFQAVYGSFIGQKRLFCAFAPLAAAICSRHGETKGENDNSAVPIHPWLKNGGAMVSIVGGRRLCHPPGNSLRPRPAFKYARFQDLKNYGTSS
jgi:hypothetical protein